ncbi:MAG: InlB B-repeat-containing protein [Bacilli bacterium]|nr:InlB B-repeat-containing protein [Bacilli bacterium]
MKKINITVENSKVGEENTITLKMLIQGAPDGYTVTPNIEIKESTEPRYRGVSVRGVEVNTNSLSGTVRDEDNAYVSNILIALVKNKEIIKETYTDENGQYVFSDVEAGRYTILVDEEIYEKLEEKEINIEDEVVYNMIIKQVEPYKLQTHKYIKKLKLINGGNELVYEYDDVSRVQQSIRKLDKIKGEIYYKVVVENVGEKTGIVTMIKDELPAGLSFDQNKNLGWELIDGVIYNRSLQGVSLNKGQKREDTLILDINETDEARTYLNKITAKGEVYEKVTFIVDGTIYKEYDVLEGEKIKNETIIEDSFDGWYTDNKYTNKYNFNNPVIKDLILYGKTNITHTVTFNDKNPETSEETEWKTSVIENGNTVAEPESPSHTGYTFKNWVDENGIPWDFENPVERDLILTSTYDINKYKVEFYNQTGESDYELVNTIYVDYKDVITNIPEVSRQYYTFKHWSLTKNGEAFDFTTKIVENTKLYSVYIINTHTVDYFDRDPETGEETRISSDVVNEGTKATEPENVPEHTGYVLDHWVTEEGETWDFDDPVLEDLKLITSHRKKSYTVEYYNGETKLDTQTYLYKELIDTTLAPTATKEGYTFTFWSLEGESTAYDFTTPVISNVKLYANFVINKNQVIFNDENRITEVEVEYGSTVNPIANQGKEHYEFVWWSLEQGGEAFDFATPITSPTILYAVYEPEIELVTFNDKNPSTKEISLYDTQNVTYGEKATRPTDPEHAGYTFLYWEDADENIYDFNERVYDNITLVSKYRIIKYNLTYNLNGGSLIDGLTNPTYYTIETEDFTLNNPNKTGYDFIGWTVSDEEPVLEKTIAKGSTGDLILTANYRPIAYNITYELDGGILEEGKTNPLTYTIEDEITLNNPVKDGSAFIGWTGTRLTGNTMTVVIPRGSMGDRSYRARYSNITHTVKFINEGNQYGRIQTVNHNDRATAPGTNPTKDYYIFSGWTKEDGTLFDFNTPITEDLVLYSSFEEIESPTISHTPTEWTNQNVTVTITSSHNDYSYQYRAGDGSLTNYTEPFVVEENTTVVAKSLVSGQESRLSTHEITNIDKIKPVIDLLTEENIQGTSFDIDFIAYDNESGMNYVSVYIKSSSDSDYRYESNVYYDEDDELKKYSFINLTEGETYSVKIVAHDNAGNASDAEEIQVTTTSTPIVARIISINGVDLDPQNYIDFPLLADAIADSNCETKCTIQMVTGTNESVEIASTQDIKLDVNGKTISGVKADYTIQNLGELTIIDTGAKAGTILNRTGIALKGEDDSTLTIGEDDNSVSTTAPYIFGKTYGIYNSQAAEFNFYDGKIEGRTAIQGLVNETPYAYNTAVSTRTGNQIATLKKITDPEARIQSVYYTKVKNAVEDAENGTVSGESTEETTMLDSFETKGLYGFTYDSENNTLTSNNDILGTTARTTLTIDLTDYSNPQYFILEGNKIGSGVDEVVVRENDVDGNVINSGTSTSSLSSKGSLNYMLENGKKYYVSITFRTTYEGTEPTSDTHTDSKLVVTKATLTPMEKSEEMETGASNLKMYGFDYDEETHSFRSTNKYIHPSMAFGMVEIDLTSETGMKDIIVNATLESLATNYSSDYAIITLSDSESPEFMYDGPSGHNYYECSSNSNCMGYMNPRYISNSNNYRAFTMGPYNYTKTVESGRKYYLQFIYIHMYDNNRVNQYKQYNANDEFIINSIDVVDSIDEIEIDTSSITTVDSSHKYLAIDMTNETSDKTFKVWLNGNSDSYGVITQNDENPETVPEKVNPFVDGSFKSTSTSDNNYYYDTLKAGKINYIHFVNYFSIYKMKVINAKPLDLSKLKVSTGDAYTKNPNSWNGPYNGYTVPSNQNGVTHDSYLKIDLTNEEYDQYLRIDASMYYYNMRYFYLTKNEKSIPFSQIKSDSSIPLFYFNYNYRSYYKKWKYTYDETSSYMSSDSSYYTNDYNYILKKGNVYYLHMVSLYDDGSWSGNYNYTTGSLNIMDVMLKPLDHGSLMKIGVKNIQNGYTGASEGGQSASDIDVDAETEYDSYSDSLDDFRYIGKNPNNYISFNDETWRILGVFDTEDENGITEKRIKIMRDEPIGAYSWDSTIIDNSNNGYGINEWSQTKLMKLLNPGYNSEPANNSIFWNNSSGYIYYGSYSNKTSFSASGFTAESKQLVDDVEWNTGAISNLNQKALDFYNEERGDLKGDNKSVSTADELERTTTWVGKVGLPYLSDIVYAGGLDSEIPEARASFNEDCMNSGFQEVACTNTQYNWFASNILSSSPTWFMSPMEKTNNNFVASVLSLGKATSLAVPANTPFYFHSAVYLKTNVYITTGSGTSSDPYILVLGNEPNPDPDYTLVERNAGGYSFVQDNTSDANYRFVGSSVNNYVSFNGHTWQIIGVFNVKGADGVYAPRIKIVDDYVYTATFDVSLGNTNTGQGINEWSQAAAMKLLNPGFENNIDKLYDLQGAYVGSELVNNSLYWNKGTGYCYNGIGKKYTECDFSDSGLSTDAKKYLDKVKWHTGAVTTSIGDNSLISIYNQERGKKDGKNNPSGYPIDNVDRTTSWYGYVGLPYITDFMMSAGAFMPSPEAGIIYTRSQCISNGPNIYTNCIGTNSWQFHSGETEHFTINPIRGATPGYVATAGGGNVVYSNYPAGLSYYINPAVYLSTRTLITSGDGSKNNPYQIELGTSKNPDDYYGLKEKEEPSGDPRPEFDPETETDDYLLVKGMKVYPFEYDETTNTYTNTNIGIAPSVGSFVAEFDMTNEVNEKRIIVNLDISSSNSYTYFHMFTNEYPGIDVVMSNGNDYRYGLIGDNYIYGSDTKSYEFTLEPGNEYYLQFSTVNKSSPTIVKVKIEDTIYEETTDDFTKYTAVNEYNEEVDTIQLLKNITLNEPLIIEPTKKVIIDLNGYQLTSTSSAPIKNYGYLTIIDSRLSEGSGQVSEITNNYGAYLELAEGKITTLNNYGEFKGLQDGHIVTLNDLEAANILDGAGIIDNLVVGSDNDTYEGYSITTSIIVDANATINSINNNEQYKPSVTINQNGVLELNNAEVGTITNKGMLIIDESVKASSFSSYDYNSSDQQVPVASINDLIVTNGFTCSSSNINITDSTVGNYTQTLCNIEADTLTINNISTFNSGAAKFDNSTFGSNIKLYGSADHYEGVGNEKIYISNSTINGTITQYLGNTDYSYYYDYGLYVDNTTISGNIEMYKGELTLDDTSAVNVIIYSVDFNSTNGTFKNITSGHSRTSYTYYSYRYRDYITDYRYYTCGETNLNNVTINNGYITNNNIMNINGATFNTTSTLDTAIKNNKGSYATSTSPYCYANLKIDGEISINNYNKGITSNNASNTITLGTKDDVVNDYPIITGETQGISIGSSIFNYYDGKIVSNTSVSTFDGISDIATGYDIVFKIDTNPKEIINLGIQADDDVASIGTTTYGTLVAAFNAAEADTENPVEIKLLKNIKTAASIVVPDNKNIKFNYNGHLVNFIGKYAFIENNGTLEVMDDSGDPKENITSSTSHYKNNGTFIYNDVINKRTKSYTRIIDNYGTAIVNSGTFLSTSSGSIQLKNSNSSTSIDDTIINEEGGNLTINDGNLNGVVNYGTAVVSGGKFTGTYLVYANQGDLLIEGGDYSELSYGKFVATSSYTTQTIIDGISFTKLNIGDNYSKMIINNSNLSGTLDNQYHISEVCDINGSCTHLILNHYAEDGGLEINNSTLTGKITNTWAKLTMNSGSINVTGDNAIDAEASYINIVDGTITSDSTAINCYSKLCITTIGTKGDVDEFGNLIVSKTNPDITGSNFVYNTSITSSILYFYDGILHGSVSGNITEIETDYDIIQPEGTQTRYLDKLPLVEILDTNGNPTTLQCGETEPADCYKLQTAFDKVGEGETVKLLRHFNNTSTDPVIIVSADKNFTFDVNSNPLNISNNNFIKNSGILNVTNSGSFNIKSSSDGYIIENDGTLNIEGSGNITYTSEYSTMIKNLAGGSASIKNATFTIGSGPESISCTNRPIPIINNGDIVMDSVTITSSLGCQLLKSNGNMTLKDSSISQNYGTKYYRWPSGSSVIGKKPEGYSNYGISDHVITSVGNLTFNNTNISRVGNLYENLNARDHDIINSEGTLTIEGGSFNSAWDVFTHTKGTTKIKDASISNQKDVIVYDGDVEVTNSTITNSKETVFKAQTSTSTLTIDKGTYSTEGKLNIRTWTEDGGEVKDIKYVDWFAPLANIGSSTMTIKDGTFTNDNHYVVYGTSSGSLTILDGTLTSSTKPALSYVGTVTLGTNDGTVSQTKPSINGGTSVISGAEYINFYDGLLTGAGENIPISEGVTRVTPETGYTVVGSKNTRYLDQVNLIKNITNGGTLYTNVQDAIDNASSGDELQFVTNMYVTDLVTIPEGKEITIDLNGLAIQKTIINNGTLNIVDKSSPDGEGGYNTSSNYNGFIEEIIDNGILNVENGVIHIVNTDISSIVNVSGGIVKTLNNSDTLNVTGGTVYKLNNTGAYATITDGIVNEIKNSGHADINGGTINTINNEVGGSINITSGNIVGPADTTAYSIKNKGDINIVGGTFGGTNIISNQNGGEINISGGTFNNSTNFIVNDSGSTINFEDIDFTSNGDVINNGEINFRNVKYSNKKNFRGNGTVNASDSTLSNLGYSYVDRYGTTNYVNGSNEINLSNCTTNLVYTNKIDMTDSTSNEVRSTSGRIKDNIIDGNLKAGGTVINNDITGNVTLTGSEFRFNVVQGNISNSGETLMTDNAINGGVTNSGTLTITSGTIDNPDGVGITNDGSLTLGEDDENVSTTIPSVKGSTTGITGGLNFYDGVVTGSKTETAITGGVATPEGYVVRSTTDDEGGTISATLEPNGEEDSRVIVVNKINFDDIQAAIDYSAANGQPDMILYVDYTLTYDLVVPEGVTIVLRLNGYHLLNPDEYNIPENLVIQDENNQNVSGSLSKFLANVLSNDSKDIIIYEMDDGSKLSAERIYKLYKLENGTYNIVNMDKEEEIGRYTTGNSLEEMKTVRSRIYINKLETGTYKLVDDRNKEINFTISSDSVSDNIRENNSNTTLGKVIASATAELILNIQTGIIKVNYLAILLIITFVTVLLLSTKIKKKEE